MEQEGNENILESALPTAFAKVRQKGFVAAHIS
jgi:hypothetical protein